MKKDVKAAAATGREALRRIYGGVQKAALPTPGMGGLERFLRAVSLRHRERGGQTAL